jgi:hypothetical protein
MSKLVLVTPEGVIVSDNEPPKVEKQQQDPLHVIAAREAAKASTTKKHN